MKAKRILVLSSEFDKSVDSVMAIVKEKGVQIDRFNSDAIPVNAELSFYFSQEQFAGNYFRKSSRINLLSYDTFWYRHPGKPIPHKHLKGKERDFVKDESHLASEGFWMALEANTFWVSKPSKMALSRFRLNQLAAARKVGFQIPNTLVSNRKQDVLKFFSENKDGIIAKAVGVGIPLKSKDGYNYYEVIFTKKLSLVTLKQNLDTIKFCPSIFQQYIDKDIEIRATVVGSKVFSCAIHSQAHTDKDVQVDWRRVSPAEIIHSAYKLPSPVEKKCVAVVKALGLEYGAIDIIKSKKGDYVFLEVNADGQYGWVQQLTGLPIDEAVASLLLHHK